jgi:hypothetical protein
VLAGVVVRTLGFLIVRGLLGLVGLGPAPGAKDVEIAVLRHQLAVVGRQVAQQARNVLRDVEDAGRRSPGPVPDQGSGRPVHTGVRCRVHLAGR